MSAVTVFVDDAVQGNFPPICARTGRPSDMVARIEDAGDFPWIAILLVFLGPIGWVALILLAVLGTGRRNVLVVRVPYLQSAYDDDRQLRGFGWLLMGGGIVALVLAFGFAGVPQAGVFLAIVAGCFIAGLIAHTLSARQNVRVSIDASRRWVTLDNVHPAFVEAVLANSSRSRR